MSGNLKDILSHLNNEIDQDLLLSYLSGTISDNDRQRLEQDMAENPFLQDAVEGLRKIERKEDISEIVNQLNRNLHQHLKPHHRKKAIPSQQWSLVAIIVIILLCVAGYYIIQRLLST